jgi:sec-independent protein translocase protein TatB
MFDLSPDKLLVLLALGLVVLGPNRLPVAARALATGLSQARRLAHGLTQPVQESLGEPRQAVDGILADLRTAVREPLRQLTSDVRDGRVASRPETFTGDDAEPGGGTPPPRDRGAS